MLTLYTESFRQQTSIILPFSAVKGLFCRGDFAASFVFWRVNNVVKEVSYHDA